MKAIKCSTCHQKLPSDFASNEIRCVFCGKTTEVQASKVPSSFVRSKQVYSTEKTSDKEAANRTQFIILSLIFIGFLYWFFLAGGYSNEADMRKGYQEIKKTNGNVTTFSIITGRIYGNLEPVRKACNEFLDRYEETFFETNEMLIMSQDALKTCQAIEKKHEVDFESRWRSKQLADESKIRN
jgi:hypothetical protein